MRIRSKKDVKSTKNSCQYGFYVLVIRYGGIAFSPIVVPIKQPNNLQRRIIISSEIRHLLRVNHHVFNGFVVFVGVGRVGNVQ